MLKFHFFRTAEPTSPSWDHSPQQQSAAFTSGTAAENAMHEDAWRWMCGNEVRAPPVQPKPTADGVEVLRRRLNGCGGEPATVQEEEGWLDAAMALAARGAEGIDALARAAQEEGQAFAAECDLFIEDVGTNSVRVPWPRDSAPCLLWPRAFPCVTA